jgi:hypothetical protein
MTPIFGAGRSDARVGGATSVLSQQGERYPTQNLGHRDGGFAEPSKDRPPAITSPSAGQMAKDQYMRKIDFCCCLSMLSPAPAPVLGETAPVPPVAGGTGADEIAAQVTC